MGAAPGLGSNLLERSQGKLQALSSVSGSGLSAGGWDKGKRWCDGIAPALTSERLE